MPSHVSPEKFDRTPILKVLRQKRNGFGEGIDERSPEGGWRRYVGVSPDGPPLPRRPSAMCGKNKEPKTMDKHSYHDHEPLSLRPFASRRRTSGRRRAGVKTRD